MALEEREFIAMPVLLPIPGMVRFPANRLAKKLLLPKLWMKPSTSDMMMPVLEVVAASRKLLAISSYPLGAAVRMPMLSVNVVGERLPVPAPNHLLSR